MQTWTLHVLQEHNITLQNSDHEYQPQGSGFACNHNWSNLYKSPNLSHNSTHCLLLLVLKHSVISLKTHAQTTKHSTYKSTRFAFILSWHCYKLNSRSSLTFIFLLLFNFFIHCQDQHESKEANLQVTKYILWKTLWK